MGYTYDRRGRLACDRCGAVGGVRRRTCPHLVRYPAGGALPYCPAPALCDCCWKARGGAAGVHAGCREGAARRCEQEAERGRRLEAGELERRTCWGSWCPTVPSGYVGLRFVAKGGREEYRLVPEAVDAYVRQFPRTSWLSEYLSVSSAMGLPLVQWADPDAASVSGAPS